MPRKADWSRRLEKPIDIGRSRRLTLHDVRAHILSLSRERQAMAAWHNCAHVLKNAAEDGDLERVEVAFRLAKMMDL